MFSVAQSPDFPREDENLNFFKKVKHPYFKILATNIF